MIKIANKIGWCDITINPITGCLNDCPYCYARRFSKRLTGRYGYPADDAFKPTFHPEKVEDIVNLSGSPKKVFLDSMGDWFSPGVDRAWIDKVLRAIRLKPYDAFMVLTKFPERIDDLMDTSDLPHNLWMGVSVTQQNEVHKIADLTDLHGNIHKFVSFEPLHGLIEADLKGVEWVIIGSETGRRKGKILPQATWIWAIIDEAKSRGTPVYVKENVNSETCYEFKLKEFPMWFRI